MRKWNAILSAAILVLFLAHAVLDGLLLLGVDDVLVKALPHALAGLIVIHTLFGIRLTVDALRVWKRTGTGYFRENALFWARRLSGFAIVALIFFHMFAFSYTEGGVARLYRFDTPRLIAQLLFVLALAVHLITNIRPALISFGIAPLRARARGILLVLSVLLLLMAAAFIVYFLSWNGG